MVYKEENDCIKFILRLRSLREEARLPQLEVAYKTGIQRQTISTYENGHTIPEDDNLLKLAIAYNANFEELRVLRDKSKLFRFKDRHNNAR